MAITVGSIVDALITLGGSADYCAIAEEVLKNSQPPFPNDPAASVRARLQENCSDYTAYKNKQDLFRSEYGSGVWTLRTYTDPKPAEQLATSSNFSDHGEEYEAREGNPVLRTHLVRERDSALIRKFKASLHELRCEACTIELSEVYGDLATNYIEAHHRRPIALESDQPTRFEDLAALCPNCHRIIHKNYPMNVEELAELLAGPDSFSEHLATVRGARVTWRTAVRSAIDRVVSTTGNRRFSRQALIDAELEQIIEDVQSAGVTPQQTLSRVLQELRDEEEIIFLDANKGEYLVK